MNIITADFNWISLLIVIGASIFGMIRSSNAKKQTQRPIFQEPDFQTDEEEEEEYKPIPFQEEEPIVPIAEDYQETVAEEKEKVSPNPMMEEEEEYTTFDIRQAIISSEILRKPQF